MERDQRKLFNFFVLSFFVCFLLGGVYDIWQKPTTIGDDVVPLGAAVDASFYLYNPSSYKATYTSVNKDFCAYIGEGKVIKSNAHYNNPSALSNIVIEEPDYSDIVADEEYIEWGTMYDSDGEICVIGRLMEVAAVIDGEDDDDDDDDNPTNPDDTEYAEEHFTDLTALLNADLVDGMYAYTDGYKYANDGGAAKYYITSELEEVDNMFVYNLKNGLQAQLECDGEINVAQVGIQGGGYAGEKINKLLTLAEINGIETVKFNNGVYVIEKPIALKSMHYQGDAHTVFSVSESFTSRDDKVLYTKPDSQHDVYTLSMDNLIFEFPTSTSHKRYKDEMILLSLQEIDGCDITNCTFKSFPASSNGAFMKTDLVWFKHSSIIDNVNIDNCSFSNYSGKAYSGKTSDHLIGGCLWFCGSPYTTDIPMNNISITNCDFTSTASDEILGVWRGAYNNFEVSDCTFTNSTNDCDNMLSLYNGSFTNTVINNCKFKPYAGCKYICKLTRLADDSDITFTGDAFELKSGVTDSRTRNIAVFMTSNDSEEIDGTVSADISISDCSVNSSKGTQYRSMIAITNTSDKNYSVSNCSVNAPLDNGLFTMSGPSNDVSVEESTIDTQNFLATVEDAAGCSVSLDNNTIKNKLNTVVRSSADMTYTFTNNKCTSSVYGTQFVCKDLSPDDSIVVEEAGNTYSSGARLNKYYTNNGLNEEDVIVRK